MKIVVYDDYKVGLLKDGNVVDVSGVVPRGGAPQLTIAGLITNFQSLQGALARELEQGRGVHPDVKFYIQFGSQEVRDYCIERGYLDIFKRAGAIVIEPSCGACINAGPGATTRPDQVSISAQNRNFPGRSGPGQLYLASPLTVAASAVEGKIIAYEAQPK